MTDEAPFAEIQAEPQLILALVQGRSPCDRENLAVHLPQLQDVLAKCWSFQASQRPTAVECLGVVQDALSLGWRVANRSIISGRTTQPKPLRRHPSWERTPTPPPVTLPSQALEASSQVDQQPQPYPSTQPSAPGTGDSNPQAPLWISSSPLASEDSWPQHGRSADSPVPSVEASVQEWTSREDIPQDEEYGRSQTGENTFDGHSATMVLVETPGSVAGSSGTQRTPDAPEAHSSVGDSRKARPSGRFPHKLYQLAGDPRALLFIKWSSDGKNIVFFDPLALQASGLFRDYFSHNAWTTVVRQLGLYGFTKIKRARAGGKFHAYHHDNFLRGREDLLDEVKLKPTPSSILRALRKQALQSIPDPLPPMT
ncbi:hypothetical protein FS837_003450 [Tulasnella sp. UAMH 9824]|nr:hypothetical protein FS837_003450 [Tulasnella sp. UAMH 9824]